MHGIHYDIILPTFLSSDTIPTTSLTSVVIKQWIGTSRALLLSCYPRVPVDENVMDEGGCWSRLFDKISYKKRLRSIVQSHSPTTLQGLVW